MFVKQLAVNLNARFVSLKEIPEAQLGEMMPPLVLDSTTVIPYRQVAFQMLYPTGEDQRGLLLRILQETAKMTGGDDAMIKKYGNNASRCVICDTVTDTVSVTNLLPRCDDRICRQIHM